MHKNVFTPENAALLLIDHQVGTLSWTRSHDVQEVKKNAVMLAKIATATDLPLVLTSSMEENVQGPLVPELEAAAPRHLRTGSSVPASSTPCTIRTSTMP